MAGCCEQPTCSLQSTDWVLQTQFSCKWWGGCAWSCARSDLSAPPGALKVLGRRGAELLWPPHPCWLAPEAQWPLLQPRATKATQILYPKSLCPSLLFQGETMGCFCSKWGDEQTVCDTSHVSQCCSLLWSPSLLGGKERQDAFTPCSH